MNHLIEEVRKEMLSYADDATRAGSQRFFKEKLTAYGVKLPLVNAVAKRHLKSLKPLQKAEIFEHCTELWQSGIFEESVVACNWSYAVRSRFEPGDIRVFKSWIDNYVNNWASCDTLCNHTVGEFIEMYPEKIAELKRFAVSGNRWMRRAAAVSLIIPARKGLFLNDIFEIADLLLADRDDLVQKGYGWMLKAASESHLQEVFGYVMRNKGLMPRTSLRYAIEKMPAEMRKQAMAK